MNWKSVKGKELPGKIGNTELDWTVVDHGPISVVAKSPDGEAVRISLGRYSDMTVEVPEPPKKVKKQRLSGTILGAQFEKFFESPFEAEREREKIHQKVNQDDAPLTIEEVEVEEKV